MRRGGRGESGAVGGGGLAAVAAAGPPAGCDWARQPVEAVHATKTTAATLAAALMAYQPRRLEGFLSGRGASTVGSSRRRAATRSAIPGLIWPLSASPIRW